MGYTSVSVDLILALRSMILKVVQYDSRLVRYWLCTLLLALNKSTLIYYTAYSVYYSVLVDPILALHSMILKVVQFNSRLVRYWLCTLLTALGKSTVIYDTTYGVY